MKKQDREAIEYDAIEWSKRKIIKILEYIKKT
jgi:hypothetical protein